MRNGGVRSPCGKARLLKWLLSKQEDTMEDKTSTFAQRLKEKLSGSPEPVHADETATELVDSQLDLVSGGHASSHNSVDAQTPSDGKL